jgi:hypothetical protein
MRVHVGQTRGAAHREAQALGAALRGAAALRSADGTIRPVVSGWGRKR